jgi:hypothetical protein
MPGSPGFGVGCEHYHDLPKAALKRPDAPLKLALRTLSAWGAKTKVLP